MDDVLGQLVILLNLLLIAILMWPMCRDSWRDKESHNIRLATVTVLAIIPLALMVLTVTALGGYQRGMAQGVHQLNQTRQLWRDAWRYSQLSAPSPPAGGQVSRMQTSRQRCVSITVTISRPVAKRVQMTRLHCPVSQ